MKSPKLPIPSVAPKPGETLSQQRIEELFAGIQKNLEHLEACIAELQQK